MANNPSFEEGWRILDRIIKKAVDIIGDVRLDELSPEEYLCGYTVVYYVTRSIPCAEKFHEKYENTLKSYVYSKVLTQLWGKNGEILLKELVERWNKYRTFQNWLSNFFQYLDGYYILSKMPSLLQTSHLIFYNLVFGEMNDQVSRALISEINRERNGEEIDHTLMKKVVEIYVKMAGDEDSMKYYEKDFEKAMLADTAEFYSRKALELLSTCNTNGFSYDDYVLKVGYCLNQEEARVTSYLKPGSSYKLSEVVKRELLKVNAREIQEMKKTTKFLYSSGAFILFILGWLVTE